MADAAVHIGENSSEYVAYRLMLDIAEAEGKRFSKPVPGYGGSGSSQVADRDWILNTYRQCLRAVRDPHVESSQAPPDLERAADPLPGANTISGPSHESKGAGT